MLGGSHHIVAVRLFKSCQMLPIRCRERVEIMLVLFSG